MTLSGGAFSAKADNVCSQKRTFFFFFFFVTTVLNGKIIMVKKQVLCLLFLKNSVLYYHGTPNKAKCGCFRGVSVLRCLKRQLLSPAFQENLAS